MAEDENRLYNGQLPGSIPFHTNKEGLEKACFEISKKLNFNPLLVPNPHQEITHRLIEDSGATSIMANTSPPLIGAIGDFLSGKRRILIIAGHSGNGKSLLTTDVRRMHEIYSSFGEGFSSPLAVITFDRARMDYFHTLRNRIGVQQDQPLPLPSEQELDLDSRNIKTLLHDVMNNYSDARILLEIPMYAGRAENVLQHLRQYQYPHPPYRVVVMNSLDMANMILAEGKRLVASSASPAGMLANQERMLRMMVGDLKIGDETKKYEIFAKYFEAILGRSEGFVVRWSPYDDINKFQRTRDEFKESYSLPNDLSPIQLSRISQAFYEARFDDLNPTQLESLAKVTT